MKKSLIYGLCIFLAAAFTACKDDVISGGSDKVLNEDTTFYFGVNIAQSGVYTRSGTEYEDRNDEDYKDDYNPSEDPDFENGSDLENRVSSIYLIFYDEDGNRVATTSINPSDMKYADEGLSPSENSIYTGIAKANVTHGYGKPTQVIAFINPISSTNFELNPDFATLHDLERTTRDKIYKEGDGFAMSKSVYYRLPHSDRTVNDVAEAPDKNSTWKRIVATPIFDDQIFKTEEELKNAIETNSQKTYIDIYVERYAAKVAFSFAEKKDFEFEIERPSELSFADEGTSGVAGEFVKLTFVPEIWAINAYESTTYATKSFFKNTGSEENDGGIGTFEQMNFQFTGSENYDVAKSIWNWNSADNHRSYWAQSPGYYSAKYPRVADDIMDGREGQYDKDADFGTSLKKGGYSLGYYSYNDLVNNMVGDRNPNDRARWLKHDNIEASSLQVIYPRENTVSGSALINAFNDPNSSPKAAISSLLLIGYYMIGDNKVGDDQLFYVTGNSSNYRLYETEGEMLNYFMNTTVHFYTYDAATNKYNPIFDYERTPGFTTTGKNYRSYFEIKHPDADVRGVQKDENGKIITNEDGTDNSLVIDSRFVTIQLNKDILNLSEEDALYAYISDSESGQYDGTYTKITANNLNHINQQMMYMAGTAQGFRGGKAYFTIPIQHLGYYRTNNKNKNTNANAKDFDWTKVQSGDFGVVRNHSYKIIVDDIKGLGNGIPNFDDPIVPPTDPEEYYIGARIIVLNWAIVPDQHVTL